MMGPAVRKAQAGRTSAKTTALPEGDLRPSVDIQVQFGVQLAETLRACFDDRLQRETSF